MGNGIQIKMPKYQILFNKLKTALYTQEYPTGSLLPSETELASQYDVSIVTVRKAVSLLREEGLVATHQGKGSEILAIPTTPGKSERLHHCSKLYINFKYGDETITASPVVDYILADEEVAGGLQVEVGEEVYRVQRLVSTGGHVCAHIVNYVRQDFAPSLQNIKFLAATLYDHLAEQDHLHVTDGTEKISAINADFVESNLLKVPVGTALLRMCRVVMCEKGVLEYGVCTAVPEYYELVINMINPEK